MKGKCQLTAVLVVAAMMTAAAAWGMSSPLRSIHGNWTGEYSHYAHGYLVLFMAIWLAWRSLRNQVPRISTGWLALPALAALVAVMIVSQVTSVDTITPSLIPLIALAAIATAFGWPMARCLFWPIVFVYTALPLWWLLNTPLQDLTAFVANHLVRWTSVPAFVQGNVFSLPAGVVEVAAGCSGLRYLNSAVALALFQGLMFLPFWRDRLKLIALAVLLALLANWLRVYSLVVIAYLTDMRHYLIRVEHQTYGWVLFLACIWPVFVYGARLERKNPTSMPAAREPMDKSPETFRPWQSLLAGGLVASLLLAPRLVQMKLDDWLLVDSSLPGLNGTSAERLGAPKFGTGVLIKDAEEERATFNVNGYPVWVYKATIRERPLSTNPPLDGVALLRGYRRSGAEVAPRVGKQGKLKFAQSQGDLSDTRVLLRAGTVVAGYPVDSKLDVKLAILRGLLNRRQDAVIWMAASPCNPDCTASSARLDYWLGGNSGRIADF